MSEPIHAPHFITAKETKERTKQFSTLCPCAPTSSTVYTWPPIFQLYAPLTKIPTTAVIY